MKTLLILDKKPRLILDFVPVNSVVGYVPITAKHARAAIALQYRVEQISFIAPLLAQLQREARTPTVAIFEDTLQVLFSVRILPPQLAEYLRQEAALPMNLIGSLRVCLASAANHEPDESYKFFRRCYERDGTFKFVVAGPDLSARVPGGDFQVSELLDRSQDVVHGWPYD